MQPDVAARLHWLQHLEPAAPVVCGQLPTYHPLLRYLTHSLLSPAVLGAFSLALPARVAVPLCSPAVLNTTLLSHAVLTPSHILPQAVLYAFTLLAFSTLHPHFPAWCRRPRGRQPLCCAAPSRPQGCHGRGAPGPRPVPCSPLEAPQSPVCLRSSGVRQPVRLHVRLSRSREGYPPGEYHCSCF